MRRLLEGRAYRAEFARLVSLLSGKHGYDRIASIEDAVQSAFSAAHRTWSSLDAPANPGAWLHRVAENRLLDEYRTEARRRRLERTGLEEAEPMDDDESLPRFEEEIADETLRMLFHCCDERIAMESRLVLALRVVLGFEVREIADLLFASEANVYKRLSRARERLRETRPDLDRTPVECIPRRLPDVLQVIYLLFTEGHFSGRSTEALRVELCEEAVRLAESLAHHPLGAVAQTFALVSLLHLHSARRDSRLDPSGTLIPLDEQDRSGWDAGRIAVGMSWLARSAEGAVYSRYHAEAAVAAEHCLAPRFEATRWERIVEHYQILERLSPSPLHTLNRALATAQWKGPQAGLDVLAGLDPPTWLAGSYQWSAVRADLLARAGRLEEAEEHAKAALATAPSDEVRGLLQRRLGRRP